VWATDLVAALEAAVEMVPDVTPSKYHEDVRRMYNWGSVAERTEKVRARTGPHAPHDWETDHPPYVARRCTWP
jgi:hypothetical protein